MINKNNESKLPSRRELIDAIIYIIVSVLIISAGIAVLAVSAKSLSDAFLRASATYVTDISYAEREEARLMGLWQAEKSQEGRGKLLSAWQAEPGLVPAPPSHHREVRLSDLHLAGRIIHSEAHWEPHTGRQAVAQTILDRYYSNPNMSLEQIMRRPGAFVIANNRYGCAECLRAAREVLKYNKRPFPDYILLHFRSGVFHGRDWWAPHLMRLYGHTFYGWPRAG